MLSGRNLKHPSKKESLPLKVGGTSGENNIANLWKDHFSAIAN